MDTIQSVERAFQILQAIGQQQASIGVNEIARRVKLPKSTVSRILQTLEDLGVVARIESTQQFTLGDQLIRLALQVPYRVMIQTMARPYLEELAELTRETVNLCLPERDGVVHVDQVDSKYLVGVRDWVGFRTPLHCVSNGKVLLAYSAEEEIERYLSRPLERFTPHTITDPDQLRVELRAVREQGYAWGLEELEEGLVGVSAPVLAEDGRAIASMNVSGPVYRLTRPKLEEISPVTVRAASRVTRLWQEYNQLPSLDGDGAEEPRSAPLHARRSR